MCESYKLCFKLYNKRTEMVKLPVMRITTVVTVVAHYIHITFRDNLQKKTGYLEQPSYLFLPLKSFSRPR